MRVKEMDMSQFKEIKDVYSFIDDNAYNLERDWDITNLWVRYRDKTEDEEEKQKAQWEVECLLFEIKGSRLFPQVYSEAKETGEVKSYPDLSNFQKNIIEYVKQRAKESLNPILRARYNHLIWKCPVGVKHNDFAVAAITSYIEVVDEYCNLLELDSHKETVVQIGKVFETLLAIVNDVKGYEAEVKELTKKLLFHVNGFEFYGKHGVLTDMLEYSKIFKAVDFENTLPIIDEEIQFSSKKTDDFLAVNFYIPTAIKIATKIKSDVRKWHNETGLAYLRMADSEVEEDRFWIKQDLHSKAIKAFALSGNLVKKQEAEQLYADFKHKVTIPLVRHDFDEETQNVLREYHEGIRKDAKTILKQESDEIYRIISSRLFFPNYSAVIKVAENKDNAFLELVTTIHFDRNNNVAKLPKEAEFQKRIYEAYSHGLQTTVLPYLHYILVPGIKSGKLTFGNFMTFITNNTWIGKSYTRYDLSGNEKNINWIALLTPSIVEFFVQVEAWASSGFYRPNFVLCVDSMVLKFEGLMRDFCDRMSIPTSVNRAKGMQEVYIHNVLDNDIIKKFFNDDDLLLFNYLFLSDGGMNLRNNVAHCFYGHEEYHPDQMFLLIAALLRLSKYDYKKKEN